MIPSALADMSRRNGAMSQGPVTDEGKARSSMNALKTGAYSNHPIDEDEHFALIERVDAMIAQYQPKSFHATDCLKLCAGIALRRARAATAAAVAEHAVEAVARRKADDALRDHVGEGTRVLVGHIQALRTDPAAAVQAIGATSDGCAWLADRFARLGIKLDDRGRLAPSMAAEAVRLLGAKPGPGLVDNPTAWVVRLLCLLLSGSARQKTIDRLFEPDRMPRRLRDRYDPKNLPSWGEAVERLVAIFDAEREKWKAEAARLRPERDALWESVRAEAILSVDRTALRRARRAERRAEADLHDAWAKFHAAMARDAAPGQGAPNEPGPAAPGAQNEPGAAAPGNEPGPCPSTTCADSTGPQPSRRGAPGFEPRGARRASAGAEHGERSASTTRVRGTSAPVGAGG